jgi:hypothetical protein
MKPPHARYAATTENGWGSVKKMMAKRPPLRSRWGTIKALRASAERALAPNEQRYRRFKRRWDGRLRSLCGNLSEVSWCDFRPLRTSREEDWSDWLAWLLESSTTGLFAESLFGARMDCGPASFSKPKVEREVRTPSRERRADIVVVWVSGQKTHIEVKVGDEAFEKTFDTCNWLRAKHPDRIWHDVILLPDASKAAWEEAADAHLEDATVNVVLWSDVARGLRCCLWKRAEPFAWRAWAWAFCRVVEAELLGLQSVETIRWSKIRRLERAARWLEVLESGPGEIL